MGYFCGRRCRRSHLRGVERRGVDGETGAEVRTIWQISDAEHERWNRNFAALNARLAEKARHLRMVEEPRRAKPRAAWRSRVWRKVWRLREGRAGRERRSK